MRIALKTTESSPTTPASADPKASGESFLLSLLSAGGDAIQAAGSSASRSQSKGNANGGAEEKDDAHIATDAGADVAPAETQATPGVVNAAAKNAPTVTAKGESKSDATSDTPPAKPDKHVQAGKSSVAEQDAASLPANVDQAALLQVTVPQTLEPQPIVLPQSPAIMAPKISSSSAPSDQQVGDASQQATFYSQPHAHTTVPTGLQQLPNGSEQEDQWLVALRQQGGTGQDGQGTRSSILQQPDSSSTGPSTSQQTQGLQQADEATQDSVTDAIAIPVAQPVSASQRDLQEAIAGAQFNASSAVAGPTLSSDPLRQSPSASDQTSQASADVLPSQQGTRLSDGQPQQTASESSTQSQRTSAPAVIPAPAVVVAFPDANAVAQAYMSAASSTENAAYASGSNAATIAPDGTVTDQRNPDRVAAASGTGTTAVASLSRASSFDAISNLPAKVAGVGGSAKPAQGKTQSTSSPANSNSTNATSKGKNGASSTQADDSQADGQPVQHAQPEATRGTATDKTVENAVSQASVTPSQISVHESGAAHSGSDGIADTSHRSAANSQQSDPLNSNETTGTSGINTARLIQSMSGTEMRVGMHSNEFGDISIRTSVSQQQMVAQISVEHGGLSAAISARIPSMQEKFGSDHGVQASVQINQGGTSTSDGREQSSQREQKPTAAFASGESVSTRIEAERSILRAPPSMSDPSRLDIRA